jgi:hypothetical protein
MSRGLAFVVGFLAFLTAHAIQVVEWAGWFGGAYEPWFLNSGRAIAFTVAVVGAAGTLGALFVPALARTRGVTLALGAFVAMTAVLFLKPGGPGTIFPIVMASGGGCLLASGTLGAWLGRMMRGAVGGR